MGTPRPRVRWRARSPLPSVGFEGGLVALTVATLTSVLTAPGQTIGVSVFIDHFIADLSLTREQVSLAYLIGTLSGAALLPSVGRFIDRRGVRLSQAIIGALFTVALINMSFVNGFVWLVAGFVGIRFFGQGSLSLVSVVTVSLSYVRNRGTAIGLYSTVSSGLMSLMPIALALLIAAIGWRSTWLVAAAVVLVSVLSLAWFGLRQASPPADPPPVNSTVRAPVSPDRSATRAVAMRTASFWLIAAVSATAGMLGTALNFHQIDLLGDVGLSTAAAAALFAPQVVGSTIAGLGTGWLADNVGTRYLPAGGAALLVLAHVLAATAAPGLAVIAYAITLGAMGGAIRTAVAAMIPALFGTGHLGSIQGTLTLCNVAASAIGPVLLAVTKSTYGSYGPAVLTLAIVPLVVMVWGVVHRPQGPLVSEPNF